MAVWRKWEVKIVDDRGESHYVDFSNKSVAMSFCRAMQRLGAQSVVGNKDGMATLEFYRSEL